MFLAHFAQARPTMALDPMETPRAGQAGPSAPAKPQDNRALQRCGPGFGWSWYWSLDGVERRPARADQVDS